MLLNLTLILGMFSVCAMAAATLARGFWLLLMLPVATWTIILNLAVINPLAFDPISLKTIIVTCTFVAVLTLCAAFTIYTIGSLRPFPASPQIVGKLSEPRERFLKAVGALLVPAYLFFLARSLFYLSSFGASAEYRMLAMGYGGESVIFQSAVTLFFFNTIMRGFLMVFLALSLQRFFQGGGNTALAIAVALMFADAVITFGRFFIYLAFFTFVIAGHLHGRRLISLRTIAFVAAGLVVVFLLSTLRFADGLGVDQFFRRYIIGYHIYGVFLLDQFVEGGVPHSRWYGGATFSGIIFLLSRPFELIGMEIPTFLGSDTATRLNTHTLLGYYDGQRVSANSFYTAVTDMLIDGGWPALILLSAALGVVYGLLIAHHRSYATPRSFGLLLFFSAIVFFSIFKNQLGQTYIVFALMFFLLVPPRLYARNARPIPKNINNNRRLSVR